MLKYLHDYKTNEMYDLASSFIKKSYTDFKDSVKAMSKGDEKNIGIKILDIVNKILNFTLEKQKQQGHGLKILTPNQCLVDYQLL